MHQALVFGRVLGSHPGSARTCRGPVPPLRAAAVVDARPLPEGLALDTATWEHTPLVVQPVVVPLLAIIPPQTGRIPALEARRAARAARLPPRAQHADRPPSAAPPDATRPTRAGPPGQPGAQPGHPGSPHAR